MLCANTYADPVFEVADRNTEIKASNTIYAEEDRVFVDETIVSVKQEIGDDEFLKATLIADVMSGPSPNGLPAIKNPHNADTFTTPSGSVVRPVGDKEQTFHFRDTRGALSLEWQKPLSRLLKTITGMSFSAEYDYASLGVSTNWNIDTDDRLTTFSTGLAYNYDIIKPVGGVHEELTSTAIDRTTKEKNKSEYDILLGVTQVVTRSTLLQANYVVNVKSGYLTDPYKMVAFLENIDLSPRNIDPYYFEKRPDSRLSHIVYFNVLQSIDENVLKVSYRYFDDDWGIRSHSTEAKYLINLGEDTSIQFKYRYHTQSAAYFYHYFLVHGPYPGVESRDVTTDPAELKYISADYRLGNLKSHAVGVKLSRYYMHHDARLDFRLDRIVSSDKKEKFETVRAWVIQLAGKFLF